MNWSKKIENLYSEMRASLIKNIEEKGVESKFRDIKVININCLNIVNDGNVTLSEAGTEDLICESGYDYGYSSITSEQLAVIVDYTNKIL